MSQSKPDKPHVMVEFYYGGATAVVSVNQLAGIVFLPQVAGVFFGSDAHDRAEQLAFHIASVSGLDIVKVHHQQPMQHNVGKPIITKCED